MYGHPAYLTYMRVHNEKCWTGGSTGWNQADDTTLMEESEE